MKLPSQSVKITTTPCTPGSLASCIPSPSISFHTVSPNPPTTKISAASLSSSSSSPLSNGSLGSSSITLSLSSSSSKIGSSSSPSTRSLSLSGSVSGVLSESTGSSLFGSRSSSASLISPSLYQLYILAPSGTITSRFNVNSMLSPGNIGPAIVVCTRSPVCVHPALIPPSNM